MGAPQIQAGTHLSAPAPECRPLPVMEKKHGHDRVISLIRDLMENNPSYAARRAGDGGQAKKGMVPQSWPWRSAPYLVLALAPGAKQYKKIDRACDRLCVL
jgi:hypothetical protein